MGNHGSGAVLGSGKKSIGLLVYISVDQEERHDNRKDRL